MNHSLSLSLIFNCYKECFNRKYQLELHILCTFVSPFTLLTMNDKATCLVKATKLFLIQFNHKDSALARVDNEFLINVASAHKIVKLYETYKY
jgi:uncharacterized protein YhfF